MRLEEGAYVSLFNGRDGEWLACLYKSGKKQFQAELCSPLKPFYQPPALKLAFAPIKFGRIDFLIQKAVELGVTELIPVMTKHTQNSRINRDRLQANAIEAAEQSERMEVPEVREELSLERFLAEFPHDEWLLYGDEGGKGTPPALLLPALNTASKTLLIGPEGGFSRQELEVLRGLSFARGLSLGPRILRADTAALAALAVIQAWTGDWEEKPRFEALG